MASYTPTVHSKVRYSQMVGNKEYMEKNVLLAKKYGIKLGDMLFALL
jgi:hypothetical protein